MAELAVITPLRDAARFVAGWARCLAAQRVDLPFRVYAADDGSTDETPRLLRALARRPAPPLEVLTLTPGRGPAAARNAAMARALDRGARLLLLLDADTRVPPDWLARHLAFHRAHPAVGVMGGGLRGAARTYIGRADGFASWFTSVPGSRPGPVRRLHISSNNMSIKAALVAGGLGFDESLRTGEDLALCRAARRRGHVPWLQPDIVATHLDRETLAAARRHHRRWGLHARDLVRHGGYYRLLGRLPGAARSACVPLVAAATTALALASWVPTRPGVLLYAPGVAYLKWHNALGVRRSFSPRA